MKDFFYKYSNNDDLIAIRTQDKIISYKKLFDFAYDVSSYFKQIEFSQQKYFPIIATNSPEFIIIILALWNSGLVPIPINSKWTEKEISVLCRKNNFELILYDKIFYNKISHSNLRIISFEEIFQSKLDKSVCLSEDKQDDKTESIYTDQAVVIFTSGATGEPKGVVHSFDSLANSILNGAEILNHNVADKWLASLPFYHIGGFQILCRALSNGCEIILPEDLEIESLKKSIEEFHPTHISLVSTQLFRLLDSKIKIYDSLKITLIGGGFCEDELIIKAYNKGWKPYRVYGSSETASFVTAANAEEIKCKPGTVGKPIKNVNVKTSLENEIIISTDSLFKEYLNYPDETKLKIIDGFYFSGDLGFIDDLGYLFIEARRTDLIVTGGENVNPIEVESALRSFKEIKEVCVFPLIDSQWGQIVAAAIVLANDLTEEKIKNELKKRLASFKIPKKFFFIDDIPKTSLGKFEREKIRKMFS